MHSDMDIATQQLYQSCKDSNQEPGVARAHLIHSLPQHAPQKLKEGHGIWHKALGGWVGVEAVVGGGLEEGGIGVKALLDQALHELLEEATPVNAGLLHAVLVDEQDLDARLQALAQFVQLLKAILQPSQQQWEEGPGWGLQKPIKGLCASQQKGGSGAQQGSAPSAVCSMQNFCSVQRDTDEQHSSQPG